MDDANDFNNFKMAATIQQLDQFNDMAQITPQLGLLTLPKEIREQILTLLILTPSIPPPLPPTNENRTKGTTVHSWEDNNYYPSKPPQKTTTTLHLVNKQIHLEVSDLISLLKSNRKMNPRAIRYELDCVVYQEQNLYPTWTLLPTFWGNYVEVVKVNLRIDGVRDGSSSGWMACGGPGVLISSFLALLQTFILRGPFFLGPESGDGSERRSIGTLALNIQIPSSLRDARLALLLEDSGSSIPVVDKGTHFLEGKLTPPGDVANDLSRWISALLSYRETYGKELVECVKNVVLCIDEVEVDSWVICGTM